MRKSGDKVTPLEVLFDIPDSWELVRLGSSASKRIRRGRSPKYSTTKGIQIFAQKCNVKSGGIDMSPVKNLDPTIFAKYPTKEYLQDQDIIVNSTGNGTLGRIGIFRDEDRIDYSVGNGFIRKDIYIDKKLKTV